MNSKRLSRIIDKALGLAREVIEEILLNEEEEKDHDDKSRDPAKDRTTPVDD